MIIRSYGKALGWAAYLIGFALVGMIFFVVLEKVVALQKWYRKEFTSICRMIYIVGICVLFRLLYARGMFGLDYYVDGAIFQWTAVFLLISIVFAICVIVHKRPLSDKVVDDKRQFCMRVEEEKLYAVLVLIVIAITPLGSDNHIYTNINNMFIVAPFTLFEVFTYIRSGKVQKNTATTKKSANGIWNVWTYPVKAVLAMSVLMLLVQSVGFGVYYVFRDGSVSVPRDTKITANDTLRGMYTSRENAETIEELTLFCKENGLIGKEVILYGGSAMAEGIPGLSYYLKMPVAISNSWPELESYPYATMEREVEALLADVDKKPVLLVSTKVAAWLLEDVQAMNGLGVDIERYNQDKKLQLIRRLVQEKGYQETFVNAKYVIYE